MKNRRILHKQYTLNGGNYQLKLPLELDILIPENDCVRLLSQLVEEMELTALYETYERMPSNCFQRALTKEICNSCNDAQNYALCIS